ncbi:MAG: nuclease [Microbacteriaceae bacterium]|nr:nuclease [Microbacteriaceae bacterium]
MNRQSTFEVLAIQRCMANANPLAWRDGLVSDVSSDSVVLVFLDGSSSVLRVVGHQVDLAVGEPVAYHSVAEILAVGDRWVTARARD